MTGRPQLRSISVSIVKYVSCKMHDVRHFKHLRNFKALSAFLFPFYIRNLDYKLYRYQYKFINILHMCNVKIKFAKSSMSQDFLICFWVFVQPPPSIQSSIFHRVMVSYLLLSTQSAWSCVCLYC